MFITYLGYKLWHSQKQTNFSNAADNCINTIASYSDIALLENTAKRFYSFFKHENRMVKALLSYVVKGNQNKAQQMPRLSLAISKGNITDISNRSFKRISPYQYALWALDLRMVRMIEEKARDATGPEAAAFKAELNIQREEVKNGLDYEVNDESYHESLYNPKPLYDAYQYLITNYETWAAADQKDEINAALEAIGLQQKLLPAHAVQEICSPNHLYPTPQFAQNLERSFKIIRYPTLQTETFCPPINSNSQDLNLLL